MDLKQNFKKLTFDSLDTEIHRSLYKLSLPCKQKLPKYEENLPEVDDNVDID